MVERILEAWPILVMFLVLAGGARPLCFIVCRLMGWC